MATNQSYRLNINNIDNYNINRRKLMDFDDDDVFDQLEPQINTSESRRFSFSVSEDIHYSEDVSTVTNNIPLHLSITIPDDDIDMISYNVPTPNNIQSALDYPKELLMTWSISNKQRYMCPPVSSHDARQVWLNAKLPPFVTATASEIERKLLDWAFTYASLEIVGRKIKSITWHTTSRHVADWDTFLKWIICASKSS